MTRVISLCNQKGGVGKTTECFHLAGAAAREGLQVLVIDADPQGNLSSSLSLEDLDPETTGLADVLSDQADDTVTDVIVETPWPSIHLVPTTGSTLAAVRQELASMSLGREYRMREALAEVKADYDLVLIDCPPSLDLLTINAFAASDALVVVTEAARFAGEGLVQLLDTMRNVRTYCQSPSLHMAGLIFNKVEKTTSAQHWKLEITHAAQAIEVPIIEPEVPKRITLVETTQTGTRLDLSSDRRAHELVPIFDAHLRALMSRS